MANTETATPTVTDTPTVTGTPTPTAVHAGGDLANIINNANDGDTIIISGGAYAPFELVDVNKLVTLQVDTTGFASGGTASPATINARSFAFGIHFLRVTGVTLDGFTIINGGSTGGVIIDESRDVTIRNFEVHGSQGDGIQVNNSPNVALINNLSYNHALAGFAIIGADSLQLLNNTSTRNLEGVYIGNSVTPSVGILLRNNLISGNSRFGLDVHPSTTGFDSDYNIITDAYSDQQYRGASDSSANPLFADPNSGNFHVLQPSETCQGGSPAVDGGDPNILASMQSLELRTVRLDGRNDCVGGGCCPVGCGGAVACVRAGQIDVGYHYVAPSAFFTPTPTVTATRPPRTPRSTNTPGVVVPTPTGPTPSPTVTSNVPVATQTPTFAGRRSPTPTRTPRP